MANRNRHVRSSGGGSSPLKMLASAYMGSMTSPEAGFGGMEPGEVDFENKNFDARQYTTDKEGKIREPYSNKNTFGRSANAQVMADRAGEAYSSGLDLDRQKALKDYDLGQLPARNNAALNQQSAIDQLELKKAQALAFLAQTGTLDQLTGKPIQDAFQRAKLERYNADASDSHLKDTQNVNAIYDTNANRPAARQTYANLAGTDLNRSTTALNRSLYANTPAMIGAQNEADMAGVRKPVADSELQKSILQGQGIENQIKPWLHAGQGAMYNPLSGNSIGVVPGQEGGKFLGVGPGGVPRLSQPTAPQVQQRNPAGRQVLHDDGQYNALFSGAAQLRDTTSPMNIGLQNSNGALFNPTQGQAFPGSSGQTPATQQRQPVAARSLIDQGAVNMPTGFASELYNQAAKQRNATAYEEVADDWYREPKKFWFNNPTIQRYLMGQ